MRSKALHFQLMLVPLAASFSNIRTPLFMFNKFAGESSIRALLTLYLPPLLNILGQQLATSPKWRGLK